MNMPTVGCVGESIIGNDERGLWFLSHKDDPSQMNWVEGEKCWGSVKVPMGLNVTRTLSVLENGELEECYTFENVSGEPLFIKEKDAYIYVPFNDSYEKAEVGLEKRCNAHLFRRKCYLCDGTSPGRKSATSGTCINKGKHHRLWCGT